jgi:hypothetical protein
MVVDVVGEDSMGFPHMVVGIDWPQTWVLVEHVGVYGPWTQSTHRQCVMFQVCLDQMVEGEEHQVTLYKDTRLRVNQVKLLGLSDGLIFSLRESSGDIFGEERD